MPCPVFNLPCHCLPPSLHSSRTWKRWESQLPDQFRPFSRTHGHQLRSIGLQSHQKTVLARIYQSWTNPKLSLASHASSLNQQQSQYRQKYLRWFSLPYPLRNCRQRKIQNWPPTLHQVGQIINGKFNRRPLKIPKFPPILHSTLRSLKNQIFLVHFSPYLWRLKSERTLCLVRQISHGKKDRYWWPWISWTS